MSLTDRLLALLGLDFEIDMDGDRFSPITDSLLLGVRPRPDDVSTLADAGVTHVVSCLEDHQRSDVAFLGDAFEPLFLPLRDGMQTDIAATFPAFFDFADAADTLYVHCERGVSRSATLAIALQMKQRELSFFDAYMAVRSRRPEVLPNIGFASQLQRLERRLGGSSDSLLRYLHEVCNVPVEVDVLRDMLEHHDDDAVAAIRAIFGNDIPRVVQGVRH